MLTPDRKPCIYCGYDLSNGSANTCPNDKEPSGAWIFFQAVGALILFVLGGVLFWIASRLGSNGGELAGIPALICIVTALTLVVSRNKWVIGIAFVVELLILSGTWGALALISAAAFSR